MRTFVMLVGALITNLLAISLADAGDGASPTSDWSSPTAQAIKRVGAIATQQHEPNFLNNFDCQLVTYRIVASNEMRSGCFTYSAFGLLDSDTDIAIYNGTDEGLPLLPFSSQEVLVPWTNAGNLIALDAVNTGGSYISLYKGPMGLLEEHRNLLGKLIAKKLTAPPDLPLTDSSGQRLVVNAQTLATSDSGSWLVAETLNGHFVRINLATLDTVEFAPSYGANGSPALLKSRVAITDNGRYVAIQNDAAEQFKVYDLTKCAGSSCQANDYQSYISGHISGLQSIRHVRFINNQLLSFEANTSSASSSGIYELAPQASIDNLIDYLALGDSYTSGEGAFDYIDGTDTAVNKCHQSKHSYPLLIVKDLFTNAGGHSVACSGAVINDVATRSEKYRGQIAGGKSLLELQNDYPSLLESIEVNYLPGYVAQQRFMQRWQPKTVTVSIGGNDIGFGDILKQCVMPKLSRHLSDSTCFNTYESRLELTNLIDKTAKRWVLLYKQLVAQSPSSQIYAISYPDIVDDTGNCARNVFLTKSELEFAKEMVVYINDNIKTAANSAGVQYVDISQALAGHRLCETASHNVAVNGLTTGSDVAIFGNESYHPNLFGQELMEQAILRATNNFHSPVLSSNTKSNKQKLLNAPSSGRAVANRQPSNFTSKLIKKSSVIPVAYGGNTSILRANTNYVLRLDGTQGQVLGTIKSDANGNLNGTVTVPPETSPGGHTIDVTGSDQSDGLIDVTQPVYVPETDNDFDGEGIVNGSDSCPIAPNSNQDIDRDGVDDACDPLIGLPPSGSSSPGSNSSLPNSSGPSSSSTNLSTTSLVISTYSQVSAPATKNAGGIRVKTTSIGHNTASPENLHAGKILGASNSRSKSIYVRHDPITIWWIWLLLIPLVIWLILVVMSKMAEKYRSENDLAFRGEAAVQ